MDEKQKRVLMTSDLKAMISSSNRDDGPSTSKRARDGPSTSKRARLMENNQATSSRDGEPSQSQSSEGRSMGHREQILDDSSDSDSSVESKGKVYPNVEAFLEAIPEFDRLEHVNIPYYMKLLGKNAKEIRVDIPRSNKYTDEEMDHKQRNFILSQIDYLIHVYKRRTEKEARKENRPPVATGDHESDSD